MERKPFIRMLSALLAIVLSALVLAGCAPKEAENVKTFRAKADLLQEQALADWVRESLGEAPAGQAGYVVFFSVCAGASRAGVYTGAGPTLDEAWAAAEDAAAGALAASGLYPLWVKADLVYHSEALAAAELGKALAAAQPGGFRYGLALDSGFACALLEGELNGAAVYDYEADAVDLAALTAYLEQAGRAAPAALPETYQLFGCIGGLCDAQDAVYKLELSGTSAGRRAASLPTGTQAQQMANDAAKYLAGRVQQDGSFRDSLDPRTGTEAETYSNLRHAGAVWALLQAYRAAPDAALGDKLSLSLGYLLGQLGYDPEGRAFLPEAEGGEVKLGAGALALIALVEYTEQFQDAAYLEDCRALGGGIIAMMDGATGQFVHVLNLDLTRKEEFRTPSYDAEAAYALARLYGITGEEIWLQAACLAAGRMIEQDYVQYCDPWVSYAMNEITKYVVDRQEYYIFALENAQKNLKAIYERGEAWPAGLELLLCTFELYDRLVSAGGSVDGFEPELLLQTIAARAVRLQDACLTPELAMYLQAPRQVLGAFMSREDGFRIRIDDLQHGIAAYTLYAGQYSRLLASGYAS